MFRRRRHIEYWERDYMRPPSDPPQPKMSFLTVIGAVYVLVCLLLALGFVLVR